MILLRRCYMRIYRIGLFILRCNHAYFQQPKRPNRVRTSLFRGQTASKFSPYFKQTQARFPFGLLTFSIANSSMLLISPHSPHKKRSGLLQNLGLLLILSQNIQPRQCRKKSKQPVVIISDQKCWRNYLLNEGNQ